MPFPISVNTQLRRSSLQVKRKKSQQAEQPCDHVHDANNEPFNKA